MKILNKIGFLMLLTSLLLSCQSALVYHGPSENITLSLYQDATYSYKMPRFISSSLIEKGVFEIKNDSIILTSHQKIKSTRKYKMLLDTIYVKDFSSKIIGVKGVKLIKS